MSAPNQPNLKRPYRRNIILAFVLTLILGVVIVFTLFLYGPNPSFGRLKNNLSTFGDKNKDTSSSISNPTSQLGFLTVPSGFKVSVFADNLGGPNVFAPGPNYGVRELAVKNDSTILATLLKDGKVIALQTENGKMASQKDFMTGLTSPNGIAVSGDWVYIAQTGSVIRVRDSDGNNVADSNSEQKIIDLPPLGIHFTRTIHIIDNSLYVSTGSSCNACIEQDKARATIQKCDLDGKNCILFGTGLRNSVDFTQYNGKIYAVDTGKDLEGNTLPPDEINVVEEGKDYGWPYCYGDRVHDELFDKDKNPCKKTEPSLVDLPAHVAAIGISPYTGNKFPSEYKNKLFVAYHGSYNSVPAVGYKIVTFDTQTKQVQDFMTGFLQQESETKGRPVGFLNWKDSLLFTDDFGGKIYQISAE